MANTGLGLARGFCLPMAVSFLLNSCQVGAKSSVNGNETTTTWRNTSDPTLPQHCQACTNDLQFHGNLECRDLCPQGYFWLADDEGGCIEEEDSSSGSPIIGFKTDVPIIIDLETSKTIITTPTTTTPATTTTTTTTTTTEPFARVTCFPCNVDNCLNCSSSESCDLCRAGYAYNSSHCLIAPDTRRYEDWHVLLTICLGAVAAVVLLLVLVLVLVGRWRNRRKSRQLVEETDLPNLAKEPSKKKAQNAYDHCSVSNDEDQERYTGDPTTSKPHRYVRSNTMEMDSTAEIDDLPLAPPPPTAIYSPVEVGDEPPQNYTSFEVNNVEDAEEDDDLYINTMQATGNTMDPRYNINNNNNNNNSSSSNNNNRGTCNQELQQRHNHQQEHVRRPDQGHNGNIISSSNNNNIGVEEADPINDNEDDDNVYGNNAIIQANAYFSRKPEPEPEPEPIVEGPIVTMLREVLKQRKQSMKKEEKKKKKKKKNEWRGVEEEKEEEGAGETEENYEFFQGGRSTSTRQDEAVGDEERCPDDGNDAMEDDDIYVNQPMGGGGEEEEEETYGNWTATQGKGFSQ